MNEVRFRPGEHPEMYDDDDDVLCRINTVTGEITPYKRTGLRDIVAVASPPCTVESGPWGGIVFFLWSRRLGLYCVRWANEDHKIQRVSAHGHHVTALSALEFGDTGQLYGTTVDGDLCTIDHTSGSSKIIASVPKAVRARGIAWWH